MVARENPTCFKCGELIEAVHADYGNTFVGDTFIRWDYESHVCKVNQVTIKPEILDKVEEILKDKHGVFVVRRNENSLVVKSGLEIEYEYDLNEHVQVHPDPLNTSLPDEEIVSLITKDILFSLIFIEEVAYGKPTEIKNFEVLRMPVRSIEDLDNITKALKNND